MKAKDFFIQEWGTGFTRATLSEKNGLVEISMEDIYSTMEKYHVSQLKAFLDYIDSRYSEQGTRDKIVDEFLSL